MAEGLLKKMLSKKGIKGVDVASCGTSALPSFKVPGVVLDLMKKEDVDLTKHKARCVTRELIDGSGMVLVMENAHKEFINMKYPQSIDKVYLLKELSGSPSIGAKASSLNTKVPQTVKLSQNSGRPVLYEENCKDMEIPDPIGQTEEIYIKVKDEIKNNLEKLINILEEK